MGALAAIFWANALVETLVVQPNDIVKVWVPCMSEATYIPDFVFPEVSSEGVVVKNVFGFREIELGFTIQHPINL